MNPGIYGEMAVPVESMTSSSIGYEKRLTDHRSPEDITERVDRLIEDIRSKYHASVIGKPKSEAKPGDVLVVAHGHILRAFAMRWVQKTLKDGPTFILEAGGVGTLSYEHHNLDEPAILLGGSFMVDVTENAVADVSDTKQAYEGRS